MDTSGAVVIASRIADERPEADTPSAGGVSRRLVEVRKHCPAGDTLSVNVSASGLTATGRP